MQSHTACFGVSTACLLLGIVLCVPLVSALEHSYVLFAWGLLLVWCVAGVGLPGCCALARGSSCCARLCALLPFAVVAPLIFLCCSMLVSALRLTSKSRSAGSSSEMTSSTMSLSSSTFSRQRSMAETMLMSQAVEPSMQMTSLP